MSFSGYHFLMKLKRGIKEILWPFKVMEYIAYFIVFSAPLYFNQNHLYPFGSPKTLLISFCVLMMVVFYAWGRIINKSFSIRITPLHIVLGIFLTTLTISSIFGVDPHNSFFGVFSFPTNLIFIYIVAIFACMVGFLFKNEKEFLPKIILVSFLSSILVSFFSYSDNSIFKIFGDHGSTLGNSSYAGAYLLFNACFGIGLFFYYKKYWQKILTAIGAVFIVLCPLFFNADVFFGKVGFSELIHNPTLILGAANGAAIGLGIFFLVMICFFLIFSLKKNYKILGVVLLFTLLTGVIYTSYQFTNPVSKIHNAVESRLENRFIAWDIAQRSFLDHPLLGSGFGNYSYNYQKYFVSPNSSSAEYYFTRPHNIIWEYASDEGVLGLIAYFSLLVCIFITLLKSKEEETEEPDYKIFRIVLISILFGYFIQDLLVFDTEVVYLILFLVIGLSMGLSEKSWNFEFSNKNKEIRDILMGLIIILSSVSIILFVVFPWRESVARGQFVEKNDYKKFVDTGIQNISLFGGVEDSSFMANKFFNIYMEYPDRINSSNKEFALGDIDFMMGEIKKDMETQPDSVRANLAISGLLTLKMYFNDKIDESGWNEAYSRLEKALVLNNYQNPGIYITLAQLYSLKEDFKNVRYYVRQAIMVNPKYIDSYNFANILKSFSPDKDFEKYIDGMHKKWFDNK